jgi:hypothetical protein
MDHRGMHAGLIHFAQGFFRREGRYLAMQAGRRALGPDMNLRIYDFHAKLSIIAR